MSKTETELNLLHKPYFSVKESLPFSSASSLFSEVHSCLLPRPVLIDIIGEQYAIRGRCLCKLNVNLDNTKVIRLIYFTNCIPWV